MQDRYLIFWVVYGYFLGDEVFIGTISMHTLQEDHHSQ